MSVTFTPEQVESQEFLTSFRGYDREEVRRFLTVVAAQMRENLELIATLERELATSRAAGGAMPDVEEATRLAAELGRHLSTAARLIEDLHNAQRRPAPEPAPAPPGPAIPPPAAPTGVPAVDPEPPAPEPPAPPPQGRRPSPSVPADRRRTVLPPEWEDLLSDPDPASSGRPQNRT